MQGHIQHRITVQAEDQLGLITRAQLTELDLTGATIARMAGRQQLLQLCEDVFRVGGAPDSHDQRVLAACLATGGLASHRTAAHLHSLHGFRQPDTIEVTVVRRRHHGPHPLAVVHSSTNLPTDDIVAVGPIPCTGVARTFLGLAALAPEVPATTIQTALGVAARDGLVSDAWLWWRLEQLRCRGRNGVTAMEEILRRRQHLGPTESWLEHRFMELLDDHGLPLPTVQRRVRHRGHFVARVDARYDDRAIIVELDGYASHSTREQTDRDERRRNELTLAGNAVLVFTYDHVACDPAYVLRTVRGALSGAAAA